MTGAREKRVCVGRDRRGALDLGQQFEEPFTNDLLGEVEVRRDDTLDGTVNHGRADVDGEPPTCPVGDVHAHDRVRRRLTRLGRARAGDVGGTEGLALPVHRVPVVVERGSTDQRLTRAPDELHHGFVAVDDHAAFVEEHDTDRRRREELALAQQ